MEAFAISFGGLMKDQAGLWELRFFYDKLFEINVQCAMIKHRHVCGFVAALQIISIGFEYLIINDSNKNAKLAVKLF